MDTRDGYVIQVIQEKAHAQQLAAAWCGIAIALQELAHLRGVPTGLPPLTVDLTLGVLAGIGCDLSAHLTPPAAVLNGATPQAEP